MTSKNTSIQCWVTWRPLKPMSGNGNNDNQAELN
jgi:hypothetical protein